MQVYQEARASDPTLAGAEATKLATDENVDQARSQLLPQIAAALSYTRTTGGSNSASFVPDPSTAATSSFSPRRPDLLHALARHDARPEPRRRQPLDRAEVERVHGQGRRFDLRCRAATAADQHRADVLQRADRARCAQVRRRQREGAQPPARTGAAALRGRPRGDHRRQRRQGAARCRGRQRDQRAEQRRSRRAKRCVSSRTRSRASSRNCARICRSTIPTPDDPKAWVELALKQNPVLTSAALQSTRRTRTSIPRAPAICPTLNAQLGYSRAPSWGDTDFHGGTFHDSSDPKWGSSIGVTLNVPIFTGGFVQSRVRQAIYNRDFARGPVRVQPPPDRSRDAQQLPFGHRRRERSRGDQARRSSRRKARSRRRRPATKSARARSSTC